MTDGDADEPEDDDEKDPPPFPDLPGMSPDSNGSSPIQPKPELEPITPPAAPSAFGKPIGAKAPQRKKYDKHIKYAAFLLRETTRLTDEEITKLLGIPRRQTLSEWAEKDGWNDARKLADPQVTKAKSQIAQQSATRIREEQMLGARVLTGFGMQIVKEIMNDADRKGKITIGDATKMWGAGIDGQKDAAGIPRDQAQAHIDMAGVVRLVREVVDIISRHVREAKLLRAIEYDIAQVNVVEMLGEGAVAALSLEPGDEQA